jgi:hypothetical protein
MKARKVLKVLPATLVRLARKAFKVSKAPKVTQALRGRQVLKVRQVLPALRVPKVT